MNGLVCLTLSLYRPIGGGFPSISKQEKSNYSPGELFKYRHEMMVWFCHGNNIHKAPCLFHAKQHSNFASKSNESMTKESFDQLFEVELNITGVEFRRKALSDYKEMFTSFCNTVQTIKADQICSISLFREKYTDIF